MPLRALVVEDEPPAREELAFRIREAEPDAAVATAATAVEALRLIKQQKFDALFVDVQMPELTGLELVELVNDLSDPPTIVFVTAYEEHALRAFELRAVDYLMKPVSPVRLRATLDRLRKGNGKPESETPQAQRLADKLPVESAGKTILVDIAEIRFAESSADIVHVHLERDAHPTRFSVGELELRLPRPQFLRIHRGCVVNLRHVAEITPHFNSTYLLRVNDAARTELTVSRGRVKDLRTLLGL